MSAQRGIFVAPFDELYDPNLLAGLAARAEERGWDGFFVWDHVRYSAPASAVADPWVVLSAVAAATERIRIGPLVTPLSRRRVHKLARETVTLDHLSKGRLVLGAGLGSHNHGELAPFGEVEDPRERARLWDTGLRKLAALLGRELDPQAGAAPAHPGVDRRALARAPAGTTRGTLGRALPDRPARPRRLAELASDVRELRHGSTAPFDLVVTNPPGTEIGSLGGRRRHLVPDRL